jgi:alginate O-acetyltransferase complex protein AlgI
MTFTSLPFLLFFPATLILFSITPSRFRWLLLLAASYFFYACLKVPHLLIVLVFVTIVSHMCGLQIYKAASSKLKKFWLWAGITANLAVLILLKYIPFLVENMNFFLGWFSPEFRPINVHKLVAIGASYFVFQGISYLIDIYLEMLEPEKHPGYFALSISFFPKLLQGPIERGGNLLPQLRGIPSLSWENLRAGANLFLWGMFKKVVVADRLATFVDPVYNDVHAYHGLSLVAATYLFALQIYFDFSGYTDMALGIARCFNIRLTQNFNSPYLATSIADFWRRWHISFSSWILDYIFKPLQFSFRDWPRWGAPLALMVTFIASGIWHGASWCFVIWGVLHGVYLSSSVLFRQQKRKLCKALALEKSRTLKVWQLFITFNLVCFSWIFFRSASIKDALYVAWHSITDIPRSIQLLSEKNGAWEQHLLLGKTTGEFIFTMSVVVLAVGMGVLDRRSAADQSQSGELCWLARFPAWAKGCVYGVLLYLIAFNGAGAQSFIYLQF